MFRTEEVRFERTDPFRSADFKSAGLNHSPILPRTLLREEESNLRPQGYEPCKLPLLYPAIYICTQREIRTPNRELRRFLLFRLSYLGNLYSKEDSNPYFKIRSLAFFCLNY